MSLNKRVSLILLGLIMVPFLSFSQSLDSVNPDNPNDDEEQALQLAVLLILDGYLYDADKVVDDLLKMDAKNVYYNYLKGFNTLYCAKDHKSAIEYFLKTIDPVQGKLNLLSGESNVTKDVYFHTAVAYHFLEDIPNAKKYYQTFLNVSNKRSILFGQAETRLKQCDVATKMMQDLNSAKVALISGPINSELAEYSPVVSANGRELYFTSRRGWANEDQTKYMFPIDNSFPEDVYLSVKESNGNWSEPKRLGLCSAAYNEASVSLTSNMDKLFVYSDIEGNGNLFASEFTKDEFASITGLSYNKLNSKSWEPHYVGTEDSSLIIFSSDRKGGFGGRDLWSMRQSSDGSWSKPINLGAGINSSEDEDAPFVSLDGEQLYYATNGEKSMGGFDIMHAKIDDLGQASGAENMGYPINSGGDDLFFSITSNGTDAYFSSFRKNGTGDNDIYHLDNSAANKEANVIALSGMVIDLTDDAAEIDLEVTLINTKTNKPVDVLVKRQSFFQVLDDCATYSFEMTNKLTGDVLYTEEISTNCDKKAAHLERNYYNGQYWLEGVLSDADSKDAINDATIKMFNKTTGSDICIMNSASGGKFVSPKLEDFKPGDNMDVSFTISAPGYDAKSVDFSTLLGKDGKLTVDYDLVKTTVIASVDAELAAFIIYFNYDKSGIRSSEDEVMNGVIKLLNDNPALSIELSSYTDDRGTDDYNQRLSDRRAKSSLKYIQKSITNPSRVTARGLGEESPAVVCSECSDEQYQLNRRTTFKVIKK
jgi:outer membrane protein OmpA-like peptidoglycan-associated protein